MSNLTKCPHCNSTNISKLQSNSNPNIKLFVETIEVKETGNEIFGDNGFAFDAYSCNDCGIVTFTKIN